MKGTVGTKLFVGFFCILFLMACSGWLGISRLEGMNRQAVEMNEQWMPKIATIMSIKYLTEHILSLELQYTISDLSKKGIINSEMEQTFAQIDQQFAAYQTRSLNEEERKRFHSLQNAWDKYKQAHQTILQQPNDANANDLLREADTMFQVMEGYLAALVEMSNQGAEKAAKRAAELHETGRRDTLLFICFAMIFSLLLAYMLTRHIRKPLRLVADQVKQVAAGRLNLKGVAVKNRDELGELAADFQDMQTRLHVTVRQVNETTDQVAAASDRLTELTEESLEASREIARSIEEIAKGAGAAVAGAAESAKAMEEMSTGIMRVAENTAALAETSVVAEQEAKQGNQLLQDAVEQMVTINQTINNSESVIRELGASSREIQQIVVMITEIASQTNLLALNAAIEAARAGEHGKGFAVVADEVRGLAEQSDGFARKIANLVDTIQADTQRVIQSIQDTSVDVHQGTDMVKRAGAAFEQIVAAMGQVSGQIQEVSVVAEQMSASVQQVAASAEQTAHIFERASERTSKIAMTAQTQVTASKEVSSSMQSLKETAQELKQAAGWFTL